MGRLLCWKNQISLFPLLASKGYCLLQCHSLVESLGKAIKSIKRLNYYIVPNLYCAESACNNTPLVVVAIQLV